MSYGAHLVLLYSEIRTIFIGWDRWRNKKYVQNIDWLTSYKTDKLSKNITMYTILRTGCWNVHWNELFQI
jgi:hypothetical protein